MATETNGFDVRIVVSGQVARVSPVGSLVEEAGEKLVAEVDKLVDKGFVRFVFNMQQVNGFSSPALAMVLDMVERIVDGKGGRIVFIGLSGLNFKVFEMVGVFLYAESCTTESEAEVQALL